MLSEGQLRGCIAATQVSEMIMEFDDSCGRGGDELRAFSDVIGEAVQDYIGEIPSWNRDNDPV